MSHTQLVQRLGGALKMEEKKASIIDNVHPNLLASPHIVGKLIDLVVGEWQPDPAQQAQLIEHFIVCSYCRTSLIVLLSAVQEYDRRNNDPVETAHDLLLRFVDIFRAIESHEYERLGAYAEAIVTEGREKADPRFPDVTIRLRICPDSRSVLEATIAFLSESEETDSERNIFTDMH
jgi:hypothetical protein